MPLWAESRIHGDVYVRFGGRLSETYHRKVAWRRQPSLRADSRQKQDALEKAYVDVLPKAAKDREWERNKDILMWLKSLQKQYGYVKYMCKVESLMPKALPLHFTYLCIRFTAKSPKKHKPNFLSAATLYTKSTPAVLSGAAGIFISTPWPERIS